MISLNMEVREIKEVVANILENARSNANNLTTRKYDTFLISLGMEKRRNFEILKKFDYQFKKSNLTLWCGKEEIKQIGWFKKVKQ